MVLTSVHSPSIRGLLSAQAKLITNCRTEGSAVNYSTIAHDYDHYGHSGYYQKRGEWKV
jgi:hypothetical protein